MQCSSFDPRWLFLIIPVFWSILIYALSYLAGWPYLASRFPDQREHSGERFSFVNGSVGRMPMVSYRHCLFLDVGQEGFRVAQMFPFGLFCPPLFIPWQEVASISERYRMFMRSEEIALTGTNVKLRIAGKAGEYLAHTYAVFKRQNTFH